MKLARQTLQKTIESLLADTGQIGDPMREALASLWQWHGEQLARMEQIIKVSDAYQHISHEQEVNRIESFNKHLHQLEKIVRISDRYQKTIYQLNLELREAATHDVLTGLANRRFMMERLAEESERAKRNNATFVLVIADADHFKKINDQYGHEIGDQVLSEIARCLQLAVRSVDLCGRWGGEEFLLLLPATRMQAALGVVERVLAAIRRMEVTVGDAVLTPTVSLGVAQHRGGECFTDTLQRADFALMAAKRSGRNRFVCEDQIKP